MRSKSGTRPQIVPWVAFVLSALAMLPIASRAQQCDACGDSVNAAAQRDTASARVRLWRFRKRLENSTLSKQDSGARELSPGEHEPDGSTGRWIVDSVRCGAVPDPTCLGKYFFNHSGLQDEAVSDPCPMLLAQGVHHLTFCGDSYVRGIFVGFLSLLLDNYEDAALNHSLDMHGKDCTKDAQVMARCRRFVKSSCLVCDGHVKVSYVSYNKPDRIPGLPWCIPWEGPNAGVFDTSNAIVWFGGTHPVNEDYDSMDTAFDAEAVSDYVLHRFCPSWLPVQRTKLIWVNAHAVLEQDQGGRGVVADWTGTRGSARIRQSAIRRLYNREMERALAKICNVSQVVHDQSVGPDPICDIHITKCRA